MAIELLDMARTWAKIKAGFGGGNMFKSVPPQPARRFVNGRDPMTEEAQYTTSNQIASAFGGKTYSQRKG